MYMAAKPGFFTPHCLHLQGQGNVGGLEQLTVEEYPLPHWDTQLTFEKTETQMPRGDKKFADY